MYIRFDRIHERDDRQTNRQTDGRTPHDGIGRAYAQHRAAKIAAAVLWFDMRPCAVTTHVTDDIIVYCNVALPGNLSYACRPSVCLRSQGQSIYNAGTWSHIF